VCRTRDHFQALFTKNFRDAEARRKAIWDWFAPILNRVEFGDQQSEKRPARAIRAAQSSSFTDATASISPLVFVGHGHSTVWRILKDFLAEELRLPWDEFNREPTPGISTTERLRAMLRSATFALLVMTGEDEREGGTLHARDNVIHEVGLFQGRLGFEKAIILLEDGCARFSNIDGLTYVGFPKGNIEGCFEAIRKVLRREGLIQ
jgi:predicted nucleotide-binding protein